MWLQLIALSASAGGTASTRVDLYTDEWIDVVMPAVRAGYEGRDASIDAQYAVDVLSGATQVLVVDEISSATHWKERRHEVDLGLEAHPQETWATGVSWVSSVEPDYASHAGSLNARTDLFDRMSTLGAAWSLGVERLGLSTDTSFGENTVTNALDVSWDQILGTHTKAVLLLGGSYARCGEIMGCQANPYRFVWVSTTSGNLAVSEHNPEQILRGAIGGRLSQAFGNTVALHSGYRFYGDSWGIKGHTGDLRGVTSWLEERLLLSAHTRVSNQGAASFYRDVYVASSASMPQYRTSDRELSGLLSVNAGGGAEWAWFGVGPFLRLAASARISRIWYRYPRFSELPERNAWVVGGGIDASL